MFLYHVTHRRAYKSILLRGLRGPRVWLCSARRVTWALEHVARHHGWRVRDMIILRVSVDIVSRAGGCKRNGVYTSMPIPGDKIIQALDV